jgi:putative ABC transport system permease protein
MPLPRRLHPRHRAAILAIGTVLVCAVVSPAGAQTSGGPIAPGERAAPPAECPSGLEVLAEAGFATRAGIEPGDSLRVGPTPEAACVARVAGTFVPPPDPATLTRERPRFLFHLPDLAQLAERPDAVDRFTLKLRPGANPDSVAALLGPVMPGARVMSAADLADQSSATFNVIRRFHVAIAWITLTASGVFLACLMILRVQQRRLPVAALRLTGVSRRTLFLWLLLETTAISVLGGVVGLGIGALASDAINAFYQRRYDTALVFSLIGPDSLLPALGLAVVLGLGAGCVAAALLLRSDPLVEAGR